MDDKKRETISARVEKAGVALRKLSTLRLGDMTEAEYARIEKYLRDRLQDCLTALHGSLKGCEKKVEPDFKL